MPVGGWKNVLRMQDELCRSNILGVGTKIISILDGDVECDFHRDFTTKGIYTNLIVNFLPIQSLEKYLYDKIILNCDSEFCKEVGDRFFKVKSLKQIVDTFVKKGDNKAFYNYLIKNLNEQGIEEHIFVTKICEMIYKKENMDKIISFLQNILKD